MENRAHALLAGLFTLALVAAAILMGVWLNRDRIERVPYEIATSLPIPGLNPQAAVRYRGLDVGKVDRITFNPDVKGQILIHISVSKETPVTQSTYAYLGYQGVTGIAFVQLDDDGRKPDDLSSSKKQVARIELRPGLLDRIQTRGLGILEQAEEVSRRLNALLETDNRQRMLGAFDDVSRAANKVAAIPDKLNARDGALDKISRAADHLEMVVDRVEQETLPSVHALTDEARGAIRSLDRTTEQIKQNPQSLLLGPPPVKPGPGESGFAAPTR